MSVAIRPIESPYYTAVEAALYLRTTVQGIYSLVKRGRLKPMPGSGRLLFTRDALDACVQRKKW
jgi:excisionase family DNA binding protein